MTLFDYYLRYMTEVWEGTRPAPEGITLPEGGDENARIQALGQQLQVLLGLLAAGDPGLGPAVQLPFQLAHRVAPLGGDVRGAEQNDLGLDALVYIQRHKALHILLAQRLAQIVLGLGGEHAYHGVVHGLSLIHI